MIIDHQIQPTENTCWSACMAMLTNRPVGEVVDQVHARFFSQESTEAELLNELRIPYKEFSSMQPQRLEKKGGFYLLCVPSLNLKGMFHSVIAEVWVVGDRLNWCVHDPCRGRKGKLFYSANADGDPDEWAVQIESWIIDAVIPHEFVAGCYSD